MSDSLLFDLNPDWKVIESVRNDTEKFLISKKIETYIIDSIIMVVSELIENAIKYGKFTETNKKIQASIGLNKKTITVEVTSPVGEQNEFHYSRLDTTIQWIRGFQNPFEAYVEKLKEISIRPLSDGESGLGIVRIAYEGQSIIDFYVSENNLISVSAVYQFS